MTDSWKTGKPFTKCRSANTKIYFFIKLWLAMKRVYISRIEIPWGVRGKPSTQLRLPKSEGCDLLWTGKTRWDISETYTITMIDVNQIVPAKRTHEEKRQDKVILFHDSAEMGNTFACGLFTRPRFLRTKSYLSSASSLSKIYKNSSAPQRLSTKEQ